MKITYYNGSTDAYSGQVNMEAAIYVDGDIVGAAEYVLFDDELTISDIQIKPEWRRKGMGSRLMKYIKEQNPEYKYVPSLKTDDGAAFIHKDLPLEEELKAKFVYESLDFERGNDPKDAMKIGRLANAVEIEASPYINPSEIIAYFKESSRDCGIMFKYYENGKKHVVTLTDLREEHPDIIFNGKYYDLRGNSVKESVSFQRKAEPYKSLEIGKYKSHIVKFKDYEGEIQTIKIQNNSFKLLDMDVRIEFKEDPDIGVSGDVYVDGQKSDINLFKIEPFDYEFKSQGEYADPGYTSYGMPIARDQNHLKELKEKHSYWYAMSGDYSRENKDPFAAAAQIILFTY